MSAEARQAECIGCDRPCHVRADLTPLAMLQYESTLIASELRLLHACVSDSQA